MIYKSVSIKNVIGRIVRSTRVQDSSYIQDMGEWIPEAMGYMKTKMTLSPQFKDINIDFHKGKLPCNLQTLSAVAYRRQRMRHNNGIPSYNTPRTRQNSPYFISQPTSKIVQEPVSKKTFTADTTAGDIWSVDFLVAGTDIAVSSILHADTLVADVVKLNTVLNNSGYGTFSVTWDGDLLTITIEDDGTVTGIKYHQVTLDAPTLFMIVSQQSKVEAVYETNELESIRSIEQCMSLGYGAHTYYTELDYINTSLCEGTVRIFFKAIPTDEEGFPLIPDNESYKEAIYWYVRAKMIGCGYIDSVFKYTDCESRFWDYAAKAMGQIKYPSVDQVETSMEISTRLILPDNYFETFFTNTGKEGMIDI